MKYIHCVKGVNEGQDIVLCEACLARDLSESPLDVEAGEYVGDCDWGGACDTCGAIEKKEVPKQT